MRSENLRHLLLYIPLHTIALYSLALYDLIYHKSLVILQDFLRHHQLLCTRKLSHHQRSVIISEIINFSRFRNRIVDRVLSLENSLRASSPGRSGGGAGKGRRACNYVSGT